MWIIPKAQNSLSYKVTVTSPSQPMICAPRTRNSEKEKKKRFFCFVCIEHRDLYIFNIALPFLLLKSRQKQNSISSSLVMYRVQPDQMKGWWLVALYVFLSCKLSSFMLCFLVFSRWGGSLRFAQNSSYQTLLTANITSKSPPPMSY